MGSDDYWAENEAIEMISKDIGCKPKLKFEVRENWVCTTISEPLSLDVLGIMKTIVKKWYFYGEGEMARDGKLAFFMPYLRIAYNDSNIIRHPMLNPSSGKAFYYELFMYMAPTRWSRHDIEE